MNKELKGRIFDIPQNVLDLINHTIHGLGGVHAPGLQRAKKLLADKKVKNPTAAKPSNIRPSWRSNPEKKLKKSDRIFFMEPFSIPEPPWATYLQCSNPMLCVRLAPRIARQSRHSLQPWL